MKSPEPVFLLNLGEPPEQWLRSPGYGLKFIKSEDGKMILHEPWSSNRGSVKWRDQRSSPAMLPTVAAAWGAAGYSHDAVFHLGDFFRVTDVTSEFISNG